MEFCILNTVSTYAVGAARRSVLSMPQEMEIFRSLWDGNCRNGSGASFRSRTTKEVRGSRPGLKIDQEFCPVEVQDPFATVEWETRSAVIKDENGKALFEQTNCEIR